MHRLTRPALLAAASFLLTSCGGLSAKRPAPIPERCPPAMVGEIIGEPPIPDGAGVVAPCDPLNPPAGVAPAQCQAERDATAAYLAAHAAGAAWGRQGWARADQGRRWCLDREKAFEAETNRAN